MDGPRHKYSEDLKNIKKVKKIFREINWKCKVYKDYAKENLGLKRRVVTGLNWVFKKVDKAIILEDDCYPTDNFFTFCESMLNFYKDNKKVLAITGNNFQTAPIDNKSYYFSKYSHIWGWATWRSTWDLFNDEEKYIRKFLNSKKFKRINKIVDEQNYWKSMYYQIKRGSLKSWAFYFLINIWKKDGLTVTPNKNLIINLGINNISSSNKNDPNLKINLSKTDIKFPLTHPKIIKVNETADNKVFYSIYKKNIQTRMKNKIKKMINFLK
tara:strand:- start:1006 stop:1812 length:807 start_codon:yes stop_codon:yes gene_type:complete